MRPADVYRHFGPHIRNAKLSAKRRKRGGPPKKGGGSEAVTVEPDRPKLGQGGAAARLEFDEP